MTDRFKGKIVLVTGAASGIGKATALAFVREGAKVVVVDLDEKKGEETVKQIKNLGTDAVFIRADVSKAKDVASVFARTEEVYGRLDCAFNNAGVAGAMAPISEYGEKDWDELIAVDLKGVWLCMKHEIPLMLKGKGGAIVNTASDAGLIGTPNMSAYTAAKHGVVGLTKTAALENAKNNIRVNAVCPGPIRTEGAADVSKNNPRLEEFVLNFCPMGRMGEPGEVAEAVLWLCSDAASYVTGDIMTVDGGIAAQ